ncbi:MAG: DDE-type integrase/transposase/recombinase [Patescibacteria group bacterium]
MVGKITKKALALELGISKRSLYYRSRLEVKDWNLKIRIEEVLSKPHCHSYGHKRLTHELKVNKKRVLRIMKKFGIKPYRRRGRKYRMAKDNGNIYPNLLMAAVPQHFNHIWVSDFTHIGFHGHWIYLATIMDIQSREIVGFSILTGHSVSLVMNALLMAVVHRGAPGIIHSD